MTFLVLCTIYYAEAISSQVFMTYRGNILMNLKKQRMKKRY